VALNGKETDGRSLRLAVSSMSPGTTIDLTVLRNGAKRNLAVTLDTMPAVPQRAEQPVPRRGRRG
jgi:S1-C subfamily serine protease